MTASIPVSVVIPVLNEKETLPFLLKGIESQTLLPQEIIFVDAGSTDNSIEIIKEWWRTKGWEDGVCNIIVKPGAFPGTARNAGIATARCHWIAFLDAGIIPENNWLSMLYDYVQKHSVKGVFGVCRFRGKDIIGRVICALSYGYNALKPVLPASLFHQEVFAMVGNFKSDIRSAEDIEWCMRYVSVYGPKSICVNAVVNYNNFPNSISSAIKKWYIYGFNTVQAKVLKCQQIIYFIILVMVLFLSLYEPFFGLLTVTVYGMLRGFLFTFMRSNASNWWKGNLLSLCMAPFLGIALDMAKIIGFIKGYIQKFILKWIHTKILYG